MKNYNISRKNFLKTIGFGTGALALQGFKLPNIIDYLPQLGIQLYTVRREIEKDFTITINKVAETGYAGVETYFLPDNIDLKYAGKVLKDAGLKVFAMHAELPVNDDREIGLRMADAYNCDLIVYHGWPKNYKYTIGDKYPDEFLYKDLETTKQSVEFLNGISEFLKTKGLQLGLHNHWWEFEKNDDDIYPYYYLLEHLNEDIIFELDMYWVKTAGLNPAKVMKDFGERAPLLHIKDGSAEKGANQYKMVPAGEGSLDFPSIVKAGGENIKWMIVEFDEYGKDIFDGIKESYYYLINNNLAKGKK